MLKHSPLPDIVFPRTLSLQFACILFILAPTLTSSPSIAEVYKCEHNDITTYSEEPCTGAMNTIQVNPNERTGMSLTNDGIEDVSKALQSDRSLRELERAVVTQEQHLENIERRYQKKMEKLENQLAKQKVVKMTQEDYKRYKQTQNKISATKRTYKADRRQARSKLKELKRDLQRARR